MSRQQIRFFCQANNANKAIHYLKNPAQTSDLDAWLKQANDAIDRHDHGALEKLLIGDFCLSSRAKPGCSAFFEGSGIGNYRQLVHDIGGLEVQPFIEVLFARHQDHFMTIFNKAKAHPDLYNAFTNAINATDLRVLNKEWDEQILQKINKQLTDLANHVTTLRKEKATTEADQLADSVSRLQGILASKNMAANTESKSSAPVATSKSPDLAKKIEFIFTLEDERKKPCWDNHRKFYKVVAANIMLAILGAGFFYLCALAMFRPAGTFFFQETARREKLESVHNALPEEQTNLQRRLR